MLKSIDRFCQLGGFLFLLGLFLVPRIAGEFRHHPVLCLTVLLLSGTASFMNSLAIRAIIQKIAGFLESPGGWSILLIQVALYIAWCILHPQLLNYALHAGWGDEKSYTGFSFDSWTDVLGNHRTLGLPLLIRIYHLVFNDFRAWPYLQMILYCASIIGLYASMTKTGFSRIMSLIFASALLWDQALIHQFLDVQTEVMAAVFLNICLALFFLAFRSWTWKTVIPLTVSVFFLYQIRPNLLYIPLLIPCWAVCMTWFKPRAGLKEMACVLGRFSAATVLPLFLFFSLRLIVVGQFGVVSMTGGCFAGHAVHYLNEKNVFLLSPEIKPLAYNILVHKRRLPPPKGLSPFEWIPGIPEAKKIELQAMCFGTDLMIAWDEAIKQIKGVEPFDHPDQYIDPMTYPGSLSGFYGRNYNYVTDRLLMKFSKEVLSREQERYRHWLAGSAVYGMDLYLKTQALGVTILMLLGAMKLLFLFVNPGLDQDGLGRWHQENFVLGVIGLSVFLCGLIPILLTNFPFSRLLNLIAVFMFPAFLCLAISPFWLKKG